MNKMNLEKTNCIVKNTINEFVNRDSYEDCLINEMARIRQQKSGLSMIVCLNPNDGTNTGQHNMPRLKFQDNTNNRIIQNELVPLSIHPTNPQVLLKDYKTQLPSSAINKLKEWVKLNYNILIQYWNNSIYEDELIEGLKQV